MLAVPPPVSGGATAYYCQTLTVLGGATAQPKRCYRPALGHWAVPPPSSGGATAYSVFSPTTVFSAH